MEPFGPIEEAIQRSAAPRPEPSKTNSRKWWIVLILLVAAGGSYLAVTAVNKDDKSRNAE